MSHGLSKMVLYLVKCLSPCEIERRAQMPMPDLLVVCLPKFSSRTGCNACRAVQTQTIPLGRTDKRGAARQHQRLDVILPPPNATERRLYAVITEAPSGVISQSCKLLPYTVFARDLLQLRPFEFLPTRMPHLEILDRSDLL
jgi:hypothetical protein